MQITGSFFTIKKCFYMKIEKLSEHKGICIPTN